MFGTTATGKGMFNRPEWQGFGTQGQPREYDLDFWSGNQLGAAWYHYRTDWESVGTNPLTINIKNRDGQKAAPGEQVKSWRNANLTYLGDAVVDESFLSAGNDVNYWDVHKCITECLPCDLGNDAMGASYCGQGYPRLEVKSYQGASYLGLRFTGTEWLQINGGELVDNFGFTDPLYTTGGAGSMMVGDRADSGASFLFVIDADKVDAENTNDNRNAHGVQALLTSRYPNHDWDSTGFSGEDYNDGIPFDFPWPEPEDYGVQYFRSTGADFFAPNYQG